MKRILQFRWLFSIILIIGAGAAFYYSPDLTELAAEKGDIQLPDGAPSEDARQYLESIGDDTEVMSLVLEFEDSVSDHQASIESYIDDISAIEDIDNVTNPFDIDADLRSNMVNEDAGVVIIPMEYTGNAVYILDKASEIEQLNSTDAEVSMTSAELVQRTVEEDAMDGIRSTEMFTLIIVVAVLLIMFRSLVTPIVPVIVVGVAYLIGQSFVGWFVEWFGFPISPQTQSFLIVILFGIGTDYCILLLNRFKEELYSHDKKEAVLNTFKTGGKTVFISGISGAIVFGVLYFANFEIYRSAVGVAVGILFLLIALYTILPLLMTLFGKYIFWPNTKITSVKESKLWTPLGMFSIKHPTRVIFIVVALLAVSSYFYNEDVNFNAIEEISDTHSAVHATHVINENFDQGQLFPVEVIVKPNDTLMSASTLTQIETLAETISQIEAVQEVQTFTRPAGEAIEEFSVLYQMDMMSDGITEMDEGLAEITDGLTEINDGLVEISTGLGEMEEGLSEIETGLTDAATSLSEGVPEGDTQDESEEEGLGTLQTSVEQIEQSLSEINEYLTFSGDIYGVAEQLEQVQVGLLEVAEGIGAANEEITAAQEDMGGLDELGTGLTEAAEGLEEIGAGLTEIETNLEEVTTGIDEMIDGLDEMSQGFADMTTAIDDISENDAITGSGINIPEDYYTDEALQDAMDHYVYNDEAMRLDVVLALDPYTREAMEALDEIEATVETELVRLGIEDSDVYYTGVSSVNRDLDNVSSADYTRVVTIFIITLFVILAVLFKSFILPIYMIGSIFITYFASVTLSSWLLGFLGFGDFNWAVPFFSLIIFAALGIDYSIFVIDRFTEELKRHSVREAIEIAVRKMGVIVITAVIILSGTFAALFPSGIIILIQVASVIIFALLFYAFIVLPLLIPAFVVTFNKGNWWPFKEPYANEKKDDYYSW